MDKRTAAPDEAAPPPPPKKAKVTSPFPLMVDVAEVEVERSFVDANIRHALASPEPHLKRDADFFRDALADFKYHSAKILDVDGDPDTDDWDRAAPSDTELDNKDKDKVPQSPPPSVDSVNSSTARILKKLGKKMPEPLPGREGREPPLFTDGLHSTHPPKTSNRVFCDLTSSDKDAVILSACWLAKLGLDWGWPDGYRLVSQQTFPTGGSRWDAYLFGHPSGKKYRSPNEFVPHLKWMAVADLERACLCKCCDGRLLTRDHFYPKEVSYY
ncbi:hypothetical protein HDU79_007553 [Rhizoclosmatium sp. JEL0117]|nr:hypothetical protein HDU79_007553 [Rhizoclosmatium sp. JEL0117]